MPRGGDRSAAARAAGKKMGRPKATRVVDGSVASRIKSRIKAEELWVQCVALAYKKARETGNTADLRNALEYLDDRDLGLCVAKVENSFDADKPFVLTIEHIGRNPRKATAPAAKAK